VSYQQQIDAAFAKTRELEKRIDELEQLGPLLHAVIAELKETRAQQGQSFQFTPPAPADLGCEHAYNFELTAPTCRKCGAGFVAGPEVVTSG